MPGFANGVMYADNVRFDGGDFPGEINTDGQILIGSTAAPNIKVGTLGAGSNIVVTPGSGSISVATSLTPTFTSATINNPPVSTTDAVNKAYVDAIAAGFDFKNTTVAGSTGPLNTTYFNGVSGVGATLTNAGAFAVFSLDGQSPTLNQRVLIKDQTNTFENGIYVVSNVGDAISVPWVLTRSSDYDTTTEMLEGSIIPVQNGTVNTDTLWLQNTIVSAIGTDPVSYQKFQSAPIVTTQHAVLVGDINNKIASLSTGTSGQILQSSGALADPAYSTATYPSSTAQGDLLLSSTANTIGTLAKDTNATRYLSNTGANNNAAWSQVNVSNGVTGVLPIANGGTNANTMSTTDGVCYFDGTRVVTTAVGTATHVLTSNGAGNAPTFQVAPAGITWNNVTGTSASMAINNGYIANNGSLVTLTLPSSAAIGSVVSVVGNGAGGWRIAQNAGQQINFGSSATSSGAGGRLDSTNRYDAIQIICTATDTTWVCTGVAQGNITVT